MNPFLFVRLRIPSCTKNWEVTRVRTWVTAGSLRGFFCTPTPNVAGPEYDRHHSSDLQSGKKQPPGSFLRLLMQLALRHSHGFRALCQVHNEIERASLYGDRMGMNSAHRHHWPLEHKHIIQRNFRPCRGVSFSSESNTHQASSCRLCQNRAAETTHKVAPIADLGITQQPNTSSCGLPSCTDPHSTSKDGAF